MKRKTGSQVTKLDPKQKKPKTLAEKRDQLQDDIMKYGVAAIEKMYPRQTNYNEPPVKKISPAAAKMMKSPIKMKPRPHGVDFEEVDVRKILRPLSHSKYIKVKFYIFGPKSSKSSKSSGSAKSPKSSKILHFKYADICGS